ncbi:hypothetical protein CMQ_3083 [Grosmannia clavigera kw1407]|uniref:Uncharacterized protein n=1 Tax=Grosmannia clavigera (strain kw1407 / UAMH 11150) TaxID=655863 RepID=F0XIA4_GROCL|nr:uncharacterized protein CMQ_3083 [Grosmannia clavigera kw1407]EFX03154.1 hypothetical protein CMQ_3083 [Grosmannia clavigera kw1407]
MVSVVGYIFMIPSDYYAELFGDALMHPYFSRPTTTGGSRPVSIENKTRRILGQISLPDNHILAINVSRLSLAAAAEHDLTYLVQLALPALQATHVLDEIVENEVHPGTASKEAATPFVAPDGRDILQQSVLCSPPKSFEARPLLGQFLADRSKHRSSTNVRAANGLGLSKYVFGRGLNLRP